jgi:hypothetical protein
MELSFAENDRVSVAFGQDRPMTAPGQKQTILGPSRNPDDCDGQLAAHYPAFRVMHQKRNPGRANSPVTSNPCRA